MAVRHYEPDAVITFGEDGLYWHVDHIGVHERTTTVLNNLGDAAPPLYYVTMPSGMMRGVVDAAAAHGWVPPVNGLWSLPPDAFGDSAAPPSLILDVKDWVPRKLAAIRCHVSQMAGHPFALLDAAAARRWLGIEHFRRAGSGAMKPGPLDLLGLKQ
jgi:LmbE family N-acetylglucosaminyl deacetylase